jgi:hypothetical protein
MSWASASFRPRLEGLCSAYREFIEKQETDLSVGSFVLLYGQESLEERNETHEVHIDLPDYVTIGNDSGDYEFLLKRDGSEAVIQQDPGCFNDPTLEVIHASFPQWLAAGCPLPEHLPTLAVPLEGEIWLLSKPAGGIKDLFRLNKLLALDWSIPQMQQSLASLPARLLAAGHPHLTEREMAEHPDLRPHLGFRAKEGGPVRSYAEFRIEDGQPIVPS